MVVALTLLVAAVVLVAGIVGLVDPASFRDTLDLAASDGFTRLAGALQLGLGTALLLSLIWREALTATLAGAVVGGAAATLATATADGTSGTAVAGFAIGTVAALVAWVARYRQLGLVLGDVGRGTSSPALAPFVRQKTIVLTSYKRDGTPVGTPVSVAVDGDRAYVRSFEKAFKSKRIANNPRVELSPATAKGKVLRPGHRRHRPAALGRRGRARRRPHRPQAPAAPRGDGALRPQGRTQEDRRHDPLGDHPARRVTPRICTRWSLIVCGR